ncbi:MAG TPA: DUF370 domain-containing protein [Firmicutes bacterium]|nr:DUF370 domain-containing protein [Bacillota bacterium]
MSVLNVGFDNAVIKERVVSVLAVNSTPVKRMIEAARNAGMLIDATRGKKVKAVVITDTNHYIISAIQPETLIGRISGKDKEKKLREKGKEPDKK